MKAILVKAQILILACLTIVASLQYKELNVDVEAAPQPMQISYSSFNREAKQELECLAENIYFEARSEPMEGMFAVAFVTMNRVLSQNYPNTICEVVKQKIRTTCQFSWYCETGPYHISKNSLLTREYNSVYNEILRLSIYFYVNYENMRDPTNGALFYHADYVNPRWRNVTKTTQIGRHIFYQDKGKGNEQYIQYTLNQNI